MRLAGQSAIHRHNAHAFVYVLEGSVVMQLKGGQPVTLTAGPVLLSKALMMFILGGRNAERHPARGVPPVLFGRAAGRARRSCPHSELLRQPKYSRR